MFRRTKIIATLGPATDDKQAMHALLAAGVNLVRVNASHGEWTEHKKRIAMVREYSNNNDHEIGILVDLQGPKIRIAKFQQGKIYLNKNDQFILDAKLANDAGDQTTVGIDYKELPRDVKSGDTLLLDDGRIVLEVVKVSRSKITCTVIDGGELSNNKGINRLGGGLSAKALTAKDKADILMLANLDVDYVGISFPRSANDITEARQLLDKAGSSAGIIAKIERTEAVTAIDEIINVADGVMVARGDLAVEIGEAEVPGVQKHIINRARALNKPVITATQMMETMIHNSVPTRAEVSDVANAVLDCTDAVMLSAETAVGDFPALVVKTMSRICVAAEKQPSTQLSHHRLEMHFERVSEAIAMATMYTANHMNIKGIIALTESGTTPLWMSRIRSGIPIYGLSRIRLSRGKMTLYHDVYPVKFDVTKLAYAEVNKKAIAELKQRDLVNDGDCIIITKGDYLGVLGGTNAMKIVVVGQVT